MLVTPVEIVTDVSDEHDEKVLKLILITLDGIVTDFKDPQNMKA
jgi:hypothetical protein